MSPNAALWYHSGCWIAGHSDGLGDKRGTLFVYTGAFVAEDIRGTWQVATVNGAHPRRAVGSRLDGDSKDDPHAGPGGGGGAMGRTGRPRGV